MQPSLGNLGRFGTLLSIAFVSPSDGVPSVLGCFGDGDGKGGGGPHVLPHQLPDVGYSPDSCAAGCAKLSFAVGGMEDGTQCFCGNWTAVFAKRHVSDGYCSTACPDPSPLSNHCGGPWYITSFWLGGGPAPAPPPTPPMPTPAPAPPGGIPDCPFGQLPYCNASLDRALRVSAMTSPPPPDFTHRLSIARWTTSSPTSPSRTRSSSWANRTWGPSTEPPCGPAVTISGTRLCTGCARAARAPPRAAAPPAAAAPRSSPPPTALAVP
jgi:hypothetical protein